MAKISARGDKQWVKLTKEVPGSDGETLKSIVVITEQGRILTGLRGGGHQGYSLSGRIKSGETHEMLRDRFRQNGWK